MNDATVHICRWSVVGVQCPHIFWYSGIRYRHERSRHTARSFRMYVCYLLKHIFGINPSESSVPISCYACIRKLFIQWSPLTWYSIVNDTAGGGQAFFYRVFEKFYKCGTQKLVRGRRRYLIWNIFWKTFWVTYDPKLKKQNFIENASNHLIFSNIIIELEEIKLTWTEFFNLLCIRLTELT